KEEGAPDACTLHRHAFLHIERCAPATAEATLPIRFSLSYQSPSRIFPLPLQSAGEAIDVDDATLVNSPGDRLNAIMGLDLERHDQTIHVDHAGPAGHPAVTSKLDESKANESAVLLDPGP
ncbi:MAG: hypothetical protein WA746_06685, partial [Isosphaeraceae bacterium]